MGRDAEGGEGPRHLRSPDHRGRSAAARRVDPAHPARRAESRGPGPRAGGSPGTDRRHGRGGHALAARVRQRASPLGALGGRAAEPAASGERVGPPPDRPGRGRGARAGALGRRIGNGAARPGRATHHRDPPGPVVQRVSERRSRVRRAVPTGAKGAAMTLIAESSGDQAVRPPHNPGLDRPLMAGFAIVVVLGLSAATQSVAWWFRFTRGLGDPVFAPTTETAWLLRAGALFAVAAGFGARRIAALRRFAGLAWLGALALVLASGRRVYAPYQVFVWYHASAASGRGDGAWLFWIAWGLILVVALLGCAAVARARHRPPPPRSDAHGSAHWGGTAPLQVPEGLLLGREDASLLRFAGEAHLLTVAPTRAGKGVSTVIPNLLDHLGSVLVTDPKGENYAVTHAWRRSHGNVVMAFDPFGVVVDEGERPSYNPVALIDTKRDDALADASLLAAMLVRTDVRGALYPDQACS